MYVCACVHESVLGARASETVQQVRQEPHHFWEVGIELQLSSDCKAGSEHSQRKHAITLFIIIIIIEAKGLLYKYIKV